MIPDLPQPLPEIVARRVSLENKFVRYVEEDLLPHAGARPYTYHQVEAKFNAVIVVPELPDGRLLLERIYRHPYKAWLWEFPAGGIEPGEDVLAAAGRELEEETGYRAGKLRHLGNCAAMPGLIHMQLYIVHATELTHVGSAHTDAMEMIHVVPMSATQAWDLANSATETVSSFLHWGLLWWERSKAQSR